MVIRILGGKWLMGIATHMSSDGRIYCNESLVIDMILSHLVSVVELPGRTMFQRNDIVEMMRLSISI